MNWVMLSFLSAFGQAFGWALKKKSLESKGINNTLGAVSFLTAGIILFALWWIANDGRYPVPFSGRFWIAALVVIAVNVIAVWAAYRALDRAPLSLLMPFISVTALAIIPVEYLLRDVLPNSMQAAGIAAIVIGAILFAAKQKPSREVFAAAGYFAVTVLCYAIAPPFMAVAVEEVRSGLLAAAVFHLGIAIGFVPLIILTREYKAVQTFRGSGEWTKILWLMVAAGAAIAFLENGPATVALESAKASEVFAIKRVMPFFALILGIMMFGEKVTKRHIIGTALLVAGSAMIVWFR